MSDDVDFGLVIPFTVCRSNGGPYDDEAFVAGYFVGQIDKELQVAAACNAEGVLAPIVRRAVLPQLELHGMRHGFPVMKVGQETDPSLDGEWCWVRFLRREEPA